MKKMMVAVCAMVAAFAALAEDALPPLKFAGFSICEKVDAAVRKARGLSSVSAASEISYRIAFYEHAFEARIRTGGRLATWLTKGE